MTAALDRTTTTPKRVLTVVAIRRTPELTVEVGGRAFRGHAQVVEDARDDERARALVRDKYTPSYGGDLSGKWRSALPTAVDLLQKPPTEGGSR